MTSLDTPLTDQQLDEIAAIAARAANDPFYVSDCEGSLQVWRENALTHVRRDANGEIEMYSFPSTYKITDQVIEIDLSTWDPGEDATDDQQRQDIYDLVESRAALRGLLAELEHVRQERDAFRDQRNGVFATNERLLAEVQESDHARIHAENETRTVRRENDALKVHLHATACLAGQQETRLRELGAPSTVDVMSVTCEPETGTRQCGHDDYHDPHEWADRPGVWCPGHSVATDVSAAGESGE